MKAPASLDTRIYRAALYLYPPEFRRDFAPEILRVFEEARRDTQTGEADGLWAFRARMAADLAGAIVLQWLRSGWPSIAVMATLVPLIAASAVASLPRLAAFAPQAAAADDDARAMALLLDMVLVVLVVIVATIFMTFWFTRPLLDRRRR
jgi:hypothetical protein